jgi:hypothetical protein
MYHKNESIDAHVKHIKTFTWSWNDAAASVLVSKKVVLENVILKIQLGKKQFDVKILFKMRHQSRMHLLFDGFVVF